MKVILTTERLILREYTMDDLEGLLEIISDGETMKYYPRPYDRDGAVRWINWCMNSYSQNGFGLWAIQLRDGGEFIGDCGISMQNIDGESLPEIGYHINKRHWRLGYASEAAAAVRDWGFTNRDFDSLYSYMNSENIPSYSTAASVGLRRIKEYEDDDGINCLVYKIDRADWQTKGNR